MSKIFYLLFILMLLFYNCSENTIYDIARIVKNQDVRKAGIRLEYHCIPTGLQQKPIMYDFRDKLLNLSNGTVDVYAYNTFTMGVFQKGKSYSNLLDPQSKFKDCWFGVYFIVDDPQGKGRTFMLGDLDGDPAALDNFRDSALFMIPMLDQKLIVYSSHQNMADYSWEKFQKEFFFRMQSFAFTELTDRQNRAWKRMDGVSVTIAALTDIDKTDMKILKSIRVYAGLPDSTLYTLIDPWHTIMIHGSVIARYFKCKSSSFWALVYYNGTEFTTKDGTHVNTWQQTDLKAQLDKCFNNLVIECTPTVP